METENYKLHLTDDCSETFKEWREKIKGEDYDRICKRDLSD